MFPFPNPAGPAPLFNPLASPLAGHADLAAQLDVQVGLMGTLALRACDTAQRLSDLHLGLARGLADTGFAACRRVLDCDNPAQMAATALQGLQPSGEALVPLLRYARGLADAVAEAASGLAAPSGLAQAAGYGAARG